MNLKTPSLNPTLLTIDVQKGFLDSSWGKRNNESCEDNLTTLLNFWRERSWPVIHVQHSSIHPNSPLRPNQVGFELMDFVRPRGGEEVFVKSVNSAFIGTDLLRYLTAEKAEGLIFTGLTTDHCVSTSCRMAANFGFRCTVVSDAVATFPRELGGTIYDATTVHNVSLASLSGEFAHIATTREIAHKIR